MAAWIALPPGLRAGVNEPDYASDRFAPPTPTVAAFYTRPLVKARLRIPDSLQDYRVASIQPSADDPARFEIEVQFQARTPFGGITAHSARFQMKRMASAEQWIVTAR